MSKNSMFRSSAGLAALALLSTGAQAQFTAGNLAVVRVGDGTAALSNASTTVFIEQLTTAGAPVGLPVSLPIAASGANQAFTNSGTATSEANLQVSADGRFLVQAGYGTAPGLSGVASTASATVPRVIALTEVSTGNVDTTTALDAFTGNNVRSATSTNGTDLWASGANGSVQHTTLGATTTTSLSTAPTNTRVVGIANGQLYTSSSSGTFQGVSTVGTGIPTTSGQTITLLNGFPTSSGPSAYDFFFADASTVYVADDRTNGSGGLQKWTESAGTWTLQYTLAAATNVGCRSVTGDVQGSVVTLYATTTQSSANSIVSVVDAGAGSTFTTISTAGANTVYRGLRLVPAGGASPVTPICFGDGTGTACPCGNTGATGNGCANSITANGANLAATGTPSIANDTLSLVGTAMPNSSVLYFQGTNALGGGAGSVFGDGLRCAGGSVIRLGTKMNSGGTSSYPVGADLTVSVRGLCSAGDVRIYQAWYRNAAAFCTASTFNLTNALSVTWGT